MKGYNQINEMKQSKLNHPTIIGYYHVTWIPSMQDLTHHNCVKGVMQTRLYSFTE